MRASGASETAPKAEDPIDELARIVEEYQRAKKQHEESKLALEVSERVASKHRDEEAAAAQKVERLHTRLKLAAQKA